MCAQSCLNLCGPMNYTPPVSPVHGTTQKKYWSRLPFPTPRNNTIERFKVNNS